MTEYGVLSSICWMIVLGDTLNSTVIYYQNRVIVHPQQREMRKMFDWLFKPKTEKYKLGDRVHLKGDKVTSAKKRAIQPNPDVWIINDITDDHGYKLIKEHTCIGIHKGVG